jgi:hypothetical protein
MPLKVYGSEYFTKEWDPNSVDNMFTESVDIETFDDGGNRIAVGKTYFKEPKKKGQDESN